MDVNKITEMIHEKVLAGDKKGAVKTAREAVQAYADIICGSISPMPAQNAVYAYVALKKCAESLESLLDEKEKEFAALLGWGFKTNCSAVEICPEGKEE